jgi:hypothetical protein
MMKLPTKVACQKVLMPSRIKAVAGHLDQHRADDRPERRSRLSVRLPLSRPISHAFLPMAFSWSARQEKELR